MTASGKKKLIPLGVAAFIIVDTMIADVFIIHNYSLLYTKLAWIGLFLLAVVPYGMLTLGLILLAIVIHFLITGSPEMFFYNFPVVAISLVWVLNRLFTAAGGAIFRRVKGGKE